LVDPSNANPGLDLEVFTIYVLSNNLSQV